MRMNGITAPNRDAAIDIPAAATSDTEPKPKAGPMSEFCEIRTVRQLSDLVTFLETLHR
jgi:hypothetical protein